MTSVLVLHQDGLHARGLDRILAALGRLPLRVTTCTFNGDADQARPTEPEIEALLAQTDHIVIAGAALNFLKRIIELNDGCPLAAIALYGLAMGLNVYALRETIDPRLYLPAKGLPPLQFDRRIDALLRQLASLGIRILPEAELSVFAPGETAGGIVTLRDVREAAARGDAPEKLCGRPTPAARDWLRQHLQHTRQEKVS